MRRSIRFLRIEKRNRENGKSNVGVEQEAKHHHERILEKYAWSECRGRCLRFLHFVLLLREALPLGWKGEGELFVPRKRALEESKFRRDNVDWTITKKFGQLEIFSFFPSNSSSSLLLHVSLFLFFFYCSTTFLSDRLKWRNVQFCSFSFFSFGEMIERNE